MPLCHFVHFYNVAFDVFFSKWNADLLEGK